MNNNDKKHKNYSLFFYYFANFTKAVKNYNLDYFDKKEMQGFIEKSDFFDKDITNLKHNLYVLVSLSMYQMIASGIDLQVIMHFNRQLLSMAENCVDYNEGMQILDKIHFEVKAILVSHANKYNKNIVTRAKMVVEENLNIPISLKNISKELNVSSSYLSRKFKQETGLTINEYILEQKMKISARRLRAGVDSIDEIARMVGYDTYSTFYRAFKKYHKLSPENYLKQHISILDAVGE